MYKEKISVLYLNGLENNQNGPIAELLVNQLPMNIKLNLTALVFKIKTDSKYNINTKIFNEKETIITQTDNLFQLNLNIVPETSIRDNFASSLISINPPEINLTDDGKLFKIEISLSDSTNNLLDSASTYFEVVIDGNE